MSASTCSCASSLLRRDPGSSAAPELGASRTNASRSDRRRRPRGEGAHRRLGEGEMRSSILCPRRVARPKHENVVVRSVSFERLRLAVQAATSIVLAKRRTEVALATTESRAADPTTRTLGGGSQKSRDDCSLDRLAPGGARPRSWLDQEHVRDTMSAAPGDRALRRERAPTGTTTTSGCACRSAAAVPGVIDTDGGAAPAPGTETPRRKTCGAPARRSTPGARPNARRRSR